MQTINEEAITQAIIKTGIPDYMVNHVLDYIINGLPIGDFLFGIFSNDFVQAVGHADNTNSEHLKEYMYLLFNVVPRDAWGSPKKIEHWIDIGGLKGWLNATSPASSEPE